MNSKEKLWNVNYIKVMTTNFLLYFAFYLLTPLLPLYLSETFGATKDTIGIVLSGYTVAALIVRPFCGYVVDSFSRKKVLMLCLSGFAVFFAGYIAAGTILMFAICRTLHGGPFGAVTVANSTCAIDVLPSSRRNEGIGLYGLSNNFAMAIAPSIGIYLHNMVDSYMILFWIAFVVAISAVLIARTIRLPEKDIIRNKEKLSLDRFFLTRAWLLAINIAMFGFCWGVLSNYLAIYSKEVLSITGGTGTYFALLSMGLFSSRLQGRKALSQGKLTQNAAEGMLISLVGFTLFVAIPIQWHITSLPSLSDWATGISTLPSSTCLSTWHDTTSEALPTAVFLRMGPWLRHRMSVGRNRCRTLWIHCHLLDGGCRECRFCNPLLPCLTPVLRKKEDPARLRLPLTSLNLSACKVHTVKLS